MENADRIERELHNELVGIWFVSDEYGSKILVKLPSYIIKAILKGSRLELLFGIDESFSSNILLTGLRIFDDEEYPLLVMNPVQYRKDHFAIAKIMHLDKVQIQFCNDLNKIQSFGDLHLEEYDRHQILCFLGNPKLLCVGQLREQSNLSLDKFEEVLNFEKGSVLNQMRYLTINGVYTQTQSVDHVYFGAYRTIKTNVENRLEGEQLEKEIFVVLRSLFRENAYHCPLIKSKSGYRELIDIFAVSEYGVFLIEAKVLGVYEAVEGRRMERKVLGVQKQIKKAIGQLVGASKTIVESREIFESLDNEIVFDRKLFPHGIVLISEMLHFGDWSSTVDLIIETMSECKMFIHVMEFQEFIDFIGNSNNDKNVFDYLLMQRAKNFMENPSLHFRTEFHKL